MPKSSSLSNILWIGAALFFASLLIVLAVHSRQINSGQDGVYFHHSKLVIQRADGSLANFSVEVALTLQQQAHGLMFRKDLAKNAGMIFIFPDDQPVSMWMKSVSIPLDMLFVTNDGKISKVIAHAVPEDLTPLSSEVPVRAVIEIGGGEAANQNIKIGDQVLFKGLGAN